jgi:hypothetical protein
LNRLESFRLSAQTRGEIKNIIKLYEKSYKENEQLNEDDKRDLMEKAKIWDDRIANELFGRKIIEIFVDGTLNSEKLVLGASTFFPSGIWVMLSIVAKSDLNDACNCLLTRSWTPSVMISLRAAEDCIRRFYKFKTGKETKNKGWKSILDDLDKLGNINKNIIGYLNYLREIRNRSEHPEEVFDQMEAERVFHQVVNMVHVINKEMF